MRFLPLLESINEHSDFSYMSTFKKKYNNTLKIHLIAHIPFNKN